MELDELKTSWRQEPANNKINIDIMELIQHKSYGPLAALKSTFKKEIVLMVLLPFVLLLTNAGAIDKVLSSFMFWSYVVFCLGMIASSYYNYRIVGRMENAEGTLRLNLQNQLKVLETRLSWNIISLRIVMVYFIIVTEVLPYFQDFRTLRLWHELPILARYGTYAGLLLLQYFATRRVYRRKYGTHISYLKSLIRETE